MNALSLSVCALASDGVIIHRAHTVTIVFGDQHVDFVVGSISAGCVQILT